MSRRCTPLGAAARMGRRRRTALRATQSLGPELRRLAWSAAFLVAVVGALFASGLYH